MDLNKMRDHATKNPNTDDSEMKHIAELVSPSESRASTILGLSAEDIKDGASQKSADLLKKIRQISKENPVV